MDTHIEQSELKNILFYDSKCYIHTSHYFNRNMECYDDSYRLESGLTINIFRGTLRNSRFHQNR